MCVNVYYLSAIFLMLHYICLFTLLVSLISMVKQSIFLKCPSDTRKHKITSALMEIIAFLRKVGQQMGDFGVICVGMMGTLLLLYSHLGEYLVTSKGVNPKY